MQAAGVAKSSPPRNQLKHGILQTPTVVYWPPKFDLLGLQSGGGAGRPKQAAHLSYLHLYFYVYFLRVPKLGAS